MRVMYLTNIPAPYRVAFCDVLGTQCDLTVVFESVNEKNRRWEIQSGRNFKSVFLKGVSIATEFHFNPGIVSHIKKFKYDVVIISGYSSPTDMMALRYLKHKKIPYIFSADGGFKKPMGNPLIYDIKKYFIGNANLYMSSGVMCDEYFMSYGVHEDNIRRYHCSSIVSNDLEVPLSLSARVNTIKKRYGLKDKVVISVGQFIPRKGFDILLDIWGYVKSKNVSLLIVGGGPDRLQYEKTIKERNLKNVVIVDFIPKAKLFELYHISDVFAFPTRYDIWGHTLGEAMACGLPVISSPNAAAAHDLINDGGNGYVESLTKPVSWARKIEEIIFDKELNKAFSKESKRIMMDYTIEQMADDYMKAVREIMPRRTGEYEKNH